MRNLNLNIKKGLKNEIKREESGGRDSRMLNFYDLKTGEKMKVMIVPDANGEPWKKFSKHGPNLKINGLEPINCPRKSSGENCPICQKGFDLLNEAKELDVNTPEGKKMKEEAKRWFAKDYTLVSVIVLDAPMEITESEDGNQIKLMYLPFAIEKIIKNAVVEGMVEEDELSSIPFFIKKSQNQGGQASYADSYFSLRETIGDEDLEFLDGMKVEQFDYSTIDLVPEDASQEDAEAWLGKATTADDRAKNRESQGGDGGSNRQNTRSKVQERLGRGAEQQEEAAEDTPPQVDSTEAEDAGEEPKGEEAPARTNRASSLRDRLKR